MSGVDMSKTIIARSDQLNADDLFGGPITGKVMRVFSTGSPEQPVGIDLDCWPQPFKPCKGMRRVLVDCWGIRGDDYVGKSLTLYRNPDVKYGGIACGGIEISHVSHIDKPRSIPITVSRGKKKPFIVDVLRVSEPKPPEKPSEPPAVDLRAVINALAGKMRAASSIAAIDECRAEFAKISAKISAEDRAELVALAEEAKARVAVI